DCLDRCLFGHTDFLLTHASFHLLAPFADDIGFGYDSDILAVLTRHGRTADLVLDQYHCYFLHGHGRTDRDDFPRHDVFGGHVLSLLKPFVYHQRCQVADATTVTPLVVVPGKDLHHLSLEHHGG